MNLIKRWREWREQCAEDTRMLSHRKVAIGGPIKGGTGLHITCQDCGLERSQWRKVSCAVARHTDLAFDTMAP